MKTLSKGLLWIAAGVAFVAFVFGLNYVFSSFSAPNEQTNTGAAALARQKTPTVELTATQRPRRTRTPQATATSTSGSTIDVSKLHVVNERRVDDILQCGQRVMVSPDRKRFVCPAVRDGRGVWLGNFKRGLTKQLAERGGYVQWFPDGKRIAYAVGAPYGHATKLYEIDLATGKKTEVGQTSDASHFQVDQNGQIFFLGKDGLRTWNSQNGAQMELSATNPTLQSITDSAFSGDAATADSDFLLSPDGKYMAITTVWYDQGTLSITDINAGSVVTVTDQIGESGLPVAWSPDGTQLAYSTRTEHGTTPLPFNGSMLWLADANGTNPREIFRTDKCVTLEYVTWAPDGQTLLFVCTEGGNSFEVDWHYMAFDPRTGTLKELFTNGEGLDLVNDGLDILILRSVENTGNWIVEISE